MEHFKDSKQLKINIKYYMIILMVLALVGFQQNLIAQQASASGEIKSVDLVQDYLMKNAESPLVKFYQADPNDGVALRAIRYAAVLAENERNNSMDEASKLRFQNELGALMIFISKVDGKVKEGMTYPRAKTYVQGMMKAANVSKPNENNHIQTDANGVPMFAIPVQK